MAGLYIRELIMRADARRNWREHAGEVSESLKYVMCLGRYMLDRHGGHYYAKAQNICRRLTATYDAALKEHY